MSHRTVIALSAGWLLAVVLGGYSWHLLRRLGAARVDAACPPCVLATRECPGAEQHPIDGWVCETEQDWSRALMDCSGKDEALGVYSDIIGEQEMELERWRLQCDEKAKTKALEAARELERESRDWLINTAAKKAIERKLEQTHVR